MVRQGYYKARAVRIDDGYGNEVWARWGKASTGTQQVGMMFEIIDGNYQGTRLPWYGSFTEKSWERTVESLKHCGFQGDNLTKLNEQTLDREVSIKVDHRVNDFGEVVNARVAFVNATASVGFNDPMSSDELRDFAAKIRDRMAGKQGASGGSTRPKADPLDDLPF